MTSYERDDDGKFIPPTQRPDGTWRKARRVKEGYVPPEEVPLYESKGKQFAQRKATGVIPGMCPMVAEAAKKEREKQEKLKAKKEQTAIKNAANNQNNKKQQLQPEDVKTEDNFTLVGNNKKTKANAKSSNKTIDVSNNVNALTTNMLSLNIDTEDVAKSLKKLRKKIREIEAIEEKIKTGTLKKPDKDQLEKMKKKKEILKEIQRLEKQEQKQQDINDDEW